MKKYYTIALIKIGIKCDRIDALWGKEDTFCSLQDKEYHARYESVRDAHHALVNDAHYSAPDETLAILEHAEGRIAVSHIYPAYTPSITKF